MKIRRISVFKVDYPLLDSLMLSGDRLYDRLDGTVVRVETDSGIAGHGEVCPLGSSYLPAYAAGVRTGIAELAPHLIGEDPTQLTRLDRLMDTAFKGHPYVKSAIDIACWDLLGQISGQPVCNLLGGRYGDDFPLYRPISREAPERMAEMLAQYQSEGFRHFQVKVGGDPDQDIERIQATQEKAVPDARLVVDANGGWTMQQALRVVRALRDMDIHIEQPCPTYEECLSVRRRTDHPFILDEVMVDVATLLRAHADRAMEGINLKITKFGGLTKARLVRDLCVSLGISMSVEDTGGGDIITAAIAHLAHSTPQEFMFMAADVNRRLEVSIANGAPRRENARMAASGAPGLGVTPHMEVLGEPVIEAA